MYAICNIDLCNNCPVYVKTGSPPSFISTYPQALSPHHKARGHQTSQTQQSSGTKQYNSSPMAATTTRATYAAGQQRFAAFCQTINASPIPATEHTLLLFATHLETSNIVHTTIKVYTSAIQHMHVSAGLNAQFNTQLTPRLQLILKGIQRNHAISHPPRACILKYPTNYAIHQ